LAQLKILQEVITLTGTSCGPACASSERRISCSADRRIYRRELPHRDSFHVAKTQHGTDTRTDSQASRSPGWLSERSRLALQSDRVRRQGLDGRSILCALL